MGRNTSISLGNYFESFVKSWITEGRYKNASEVVLQDCDYWKNEKIKCAH